MLSARHTVTPSRVTAHPGHPVLRRRPSPRLTGVGPGNAESR